jgi:hypothetical protein
VFGAAATIGLDESKINATKIYPNPGNKEFSIESETMIKDLKVYDATGQLVISQRVNALSADVNASQLSNGMYFIHLEKDSSIQKLRWVKQN